ncbi:dihydropteroate synthase [candidate division KSB1 bacterium]|nr:dihydropteroate synthase [candidate division KSB1 bacterium]
MSGSRKVYKWTCGDITLELGRRTLVMGILNITPDSFSDGGLYNSMDSAVAKGLEMVNHGADIIDIGGESTRPGARPVELTEELERVLPVIENLAKKSNVPISIDTYKFPVAQAAIKAGAKIVNDISGLRFSPEIAEIVAQSGTGLVIMHIKGTPQNMQKEPRYQNLLKEITEYLNQGIQIAQNAGIPKHGIVIDPGIGFGKTLDDNYRIIKNLSTFTQMEFPVLVGPSRKSFIGNVLDLPPDQRLEGTAAAVTACILNGAHIVRVHDVKEMKRVTSIADMIERA